MWGPLGVVVSGAGVVFSIWSERRSSVEVAELKERLSKLDSNVKDVLDHWSRHANDAGIRIQEHKTLDKPLEPASAWVQKLERASADTDRPKASVLVQSLGGNQCDSFEIDTELVKKLLVPHAMSETGAIRELVPPSKGDSAAGMVIDLLRKNENELAVKLLETKKERNWQLQNLLAIAQMRLGRPEEALKALNAAESGPDSMRAILSFNQAVVLYQMERFSEALERFREALVEPTVADEAIVGLLDSAARLSSSNAS